LLRLLCDPLRDDLHTAPRDSRTLGITAEKRWLLTFDNMGEMPEWLSNLLCLTSTGGTMPLRELYTDADEILFELRRIVVLTSVAQLVEREDLLDRLFLLHLRSIPPRERLTEQEWEDKVTPLLPKALGGLYSAVSYVLATFETAPRPQELPRLADWARYAALAAETFGKTQQDFFTTWEAVGQRQASEAADASPLPAVLEHFMAGQPEEKWKGNCCTWVGLSSALHTELTNTATSMQPPVDLKHALWPKDARWLSRRLDEQHSAVAARNLAVSRRETKQGAELTVTYTKPQPEPTQDKDPSQNGADDVATVATVATDAASGLDAPTMGGPARNGRGGDSHLDDVPDPVATVATLAVMATGDAAEHCAGGDVGVDVGADVGGNVGAGIGADVGGDSGRVGGDSGDTDGRHDGDLVLMSPPVAASSISGEGPLGGNSGDSGDSGDSIRIKTGGEERQTSISVTCAATQAALTTELALGADELAPCHGVLERFAEMTAELLTPVREPVAGFEIGPEWPDVHTITEMPVPDAEDEEETS
jgi:hypothetical protein